MLVKQYLEGNHIFHSEGAYIHRTIFNSELRKDYVGLASRVLLDNYTVTYAAITIEIENRK